MSFGDWNGDGDVSMGEALGTAALLSGPMSQLVDRIYPLAYSRVKIRTTI